LIHDSDLLGSLHATVQSKPSYLKIITWDWKISVWMKT
jgi:hypothetical protein